MFGIEAWIIFFSIVITAIAIDILLSIKRSNMSYRSSVYMTLCWITLSLIFSLAIFLYSDLNYSLLFLTGYVIELSLSIDNIFVFILIFNQFNLSHHAQHKILMIGIFSAIVMRLIMISAGIYLIQQFQWLFYIFGIILIYSGIHIIFSREKDEGMKNDNAIVNFFKKWLPIVETNYSNNFIVKRNGKYYGTTMLIVLILIEKADLVFALDSIPAILSITDNTFIVFTSNIFAILGLRSMYFMLSRVLKKFIYIKYALSFILCYIGLKMIAGALGFHIPILASLAIIIFSITIAIITSHYSANQSIKK